MSAYRLVLPSARRLHYLHLNVQGGKAALPPSFLPGRKRLYGAPAPPTRRPVGCSSACLYGILKYPDCTLPPKRKDIRKDVLSFWVPAARGGLHPSALECSGRRSRVPSRVPWCRQELDLLTKIKYRLRNHILSPHFIHIYCRKDGLSHSLEV